METLVSVSPENLNTLLRTNAELTMQLRVKQKRIDFLEMVLAQRQDLTVKAFDPEKVDEMKRKVEALWLGAAPGTGFTYEEAEQEFFSTYKFRSACVPQRMRDLRQEGILWSTLIDGKVTFFLKLKKLPGDSA